MSKSQTSKHTWIYCNRKICRQALKKRPVTQSTVSKQDKLLGLTKGLAIGETTQTPIISLSGQTVWCSRCLWLKGLQLVSLPTQTTMSTLSSPRAESARAVTGRRCPHSGVGEDFLAHWPVFLWKGPFLGNQKSKNQSQGAKSTVSASSTIWPLTKSRVL